MRPSSTISACAGTRMSLVRHFTTSSGRPCSAPAMVSSSKSSGAIACEASSVSGSTPITIATGKIAAGLLGHLEEAQRVARQQQHAEPVRAAELQAVDGDVLRAGLRVARDQQAGRDVGPAVELVVHRDRQQPRQIDLAMHHLLRGRARDLAPGQGIERGLLEGREQAVVGDAHRLGHPAAVGGQPGDHRNRMAVRAAERASPCWPSSVLAMAASSKRSLTPGRATASRSLAASISSQARRSVTGLRSAEEGMVGRNAFVHRGSLRSIGRKIVT